MNEMKIKALAPWFGGKRNLASRIVSSLGPHKVYWEPFCGSMAVLLCKKPCIMETVNDLHGDLINLARVIQFEPMGKDLYERLSKTLMHEQFFIEAANRCKSRGYYENFEQPDLDRAYDFFLASWLGRNGTIGTKSYNWTYCVRYTSSGGHAAKRWDSVIKSIPAWHKRLMNVTILNRDGFEIIERIEDKKNTAIYIDPPYLIKGADYIYDFKSEDHIKLSELLKRFKKTKVVLSYYEHEKLKELYPEWAQVKIEVSKSIAHQGARGKNKTKAVEVLLCNKNIESGLFE